MPQPLQYSKSDVLDEVTEIMYKSKKIVHTKNNTVLANRIYWHKWYAHYWQFLDNCFKIMQDDSRGIPDKLLQEYLDYKFSLPVGLCYTAEEIISEGIERLNKYILENNNLPTHQDSKIIQRMIKNKVFGFNSSFDVITECIESLEKQDLLTADLKKLFRKYQLRNQDLAPKNRYVGPEGLDYAINQSVQFMYTNKKLPRSSAQTIGDRIDNTGSKLYTQVSKRREEWGISGWAEFLHLCLSRMRKMDEGLPDNIWNDFMRLGIEDNEKLTHEQWLNNYDYSLAELVKHMEVNEKLVIKKSSKKIRSISIQLKNADIRIAWKVNSWNEMVKIAISRIKDEKLRSKLEIQHIDYMDRYY